MHSMLAWPLSSTYSKFNWSHSCTAKDLTVAGGQRSREHTEVLVSELELGVLWDEYGLVGDCYNSFTHFFPLIFLIYSLHAPTSCLLFLVYILISFY